MRGTPPIRVAADLWRETRTRFDRSGLRSTQHYPHQQNLSSLTQPFSEQEIHKALWAIPRDKSPGPNGFGSAFFQDFWTLVKPDILNLFQRFYEGNLQLNRNNRSFMVLIKKKNNMCIPESYRPISLLNCPVKLITKVLAIRLQQQMTNLVDTDQTGFVQSRCIADNFIYALDIAQCYKLRKKETIVLKLDFQKSF
jgi:hypothetical protein